MRFLPFFLFLTALLSACMGEDDYTVSPNDRLGRPRGNKPDMGCYQLVRQD